MSKRKYTEYFINGKKADLKTIKSRKGKIVSTIVTEQKYYEAPLTEQEKEEKAIASRNSMKFFQEMRDLREDQEKFH